MSAKPSIDSIFCSAIEIESPDERRAQVAQACGQDADLKRRVERLLHAHFHGRSILDAPVQPVATVDEPHRQTAGAMIGPYKLLEELGEGGMGTVWMAQQTEPVKRLVALKLIKAGMDSKQVLARFRAAKTAPRWRACTTWPTVTAPWAATPRPCSSTRRRWRCRRPPWAPRTPTRW
jgi:hypothetical protein